MRLCAPAFLFLRKTQGRKVAKKAILFQGSQLDWATPQMTTILLNAALCIALALFLWMPLGRWFLQRVFGGQAPDAWAASAALGLGFWGLWVLLLGLVGALYSAVLLASAAAGAALLAFSSGRRSDAAPQRDASVLPAYPRRALISAFALLSVLYIVIVTASAFAPELSFDALYVHLPYARDAAASHHISFAPNNWSAAMPALPLMFYITGFLFSGVALAKLFNTLCYFLIGAIIYYFCRRWASALHGIVGAALFWSSPVALYEATTALIDLPLTLYSGIAVLSLLEWTRQDEDSFLWLSAVSLGFAFGCKYHAAFWFVPVVLVMTWHLLVSRRSRKRTFITKLLLYSSIVFLLFLPWMLRTWIYTGNPVFPLANGIFKSPYFTPAMERASWDAFANEGVGRSWKALLSLPWTVTFHPGPFRGTLGVVFFFGVLLALFRSKTVQLRYALVIAAFHFYTWGLVAQEIRYLLPLAPLLAVVTSFGFLGSRDEPKTAGEVSSARGGLLSLRQGFKMAGCAVLLAGVVSSYPSLYPSWVKEWTYWHSYLPPWRVLMGRVSAQEYLQRDIPSIYVFDYINQKLRPQDRVLLLNDHAQFYSRVPTLYSFTVEGERILLENTEQGVLDGLKASHITYVLLNYNGIAPLPRVQPRMGVYFFLDKGFQERNLEVAYSENNVILYRVLSH